MKLTTLSLFALLVLVAVPAAADSPDRATVPGDPAFFTTPDMSQNASPAFAQALEDGRVELADFGEFGFCSATADCAGGGSVSCTAQSGSCWFVDYCYAVCNNQYYWCGYRPYPCPV